MIQYLGVQSVITVHDLIVPCPVINFEMLSSAVHQPQATYLGADLHETMHEKAAVLLRGLAANHAFQDGNKRTAWASTQIFLAANGAPLYQIDDLQGADFVERVVVEKLAIRVIAEWLIHRMAV